VCASENGQSKQAHVCNRHGQALSQNPGVISLLYHLLLWRALLAYRVFVSTSVLVGDCASKV
jgi:hypothetical protein